MFSFCALKIKSNLNHCPESVTLNFMNYKTRFPDLKLTWLMSKVEESGHSRIYTYINLNGSFDCRGYSVLFIYGWWLSWQLILLRISLESLHIFSWFNTKESISMLLCVSETHKLYFISNKINTIQVRKFWLQVHASVCWRKWY